MINKNIVVIGLVCSVLNGAEQTIVSTMNHDDSTLSAVSIKTPSINTLCSEEQEPQQKEVNLSNQTTDEHLVIESVVETIGTSDNEQIPSDASSKREVVFQDDLLDLVNLDETCKKHVDRFKQLNIIIKAVNEYHCPRGETIEVTIQNNKWTIVIKNITEDLLLECIPVQELLPQTTSKNRLDRYLNLASHYMTKMGIYIWQKTLAQYAKCTVIINGNIHPEEKHILCSDVIIDIVDWAQQKLLNINRSATDLLNTQIVISKK